MKKMRKRKRDFIKEKRTVRKLVLVLFGLVFVMAHILVFNLALGKPFTFSYAADLVTFSQQIMPVNPVEKTDPLAKENKQAHDLSSSDYLIITPLNASQSEENNPRDQKLLTRPVVTFSGTSIYPNSEIFLDIHSNRFFSSTLSDNQGRWTWTNYGNPLDPGDHVIEAYSISPLEVAGKRGILAQKYHFTVTDGMIGSNYVALGNTNYGKEGGEDTLGERITKNDIEGTYLFNVALLNKKEYNYGDDMQVELLFSPLAQDINRSVAIKYAIYATEGDGTSNENLAAEFADEANLSGGGYFLKNIKLKENLMPGKYILKVTAQIGSDNYFQSARFNISPKTLMTIGAKTITTEKFGQTVVFNVILIVGILIILVAIMIVEFKRFMVYGPIDERMLRKKGYLSK